jgi:hypothetical protein
LTSKQKVEAALKNIDERPIRGEMKVWIVSHYLLTSLHFHLQSTESFPLTILKKLHGADYPDPTEEVVEASL